MEDGQVGQDYQRDYFESVIKKYECRNAQFTQRHCELQTRLEAVECFLPAIMCYNIMQPKNETVKSTAVKYDSPVKDEPPTNIRNQEQSFKNPRDDRNLRSCNCDLCPLNPNYIIKNEPAKIPTTSVNVRNDMNMRNCSCNPCPINKDVLIVSEKSILENENSVKSNEPIIPFNSNTCNFVKSDDIPYMNRIRELARTEKKLKEELRELENREKVYADTLKQPTDWPAKESGCNGEGDFEFEALERINHQLECENQSLEKELEQVRKEIIHIHDTIEEPAKKELESEKRKYLILEEKIQKRSTNIKNRETEQQNKEDFLKKQLQNANQNLNDLHIVNKRLKEELCMLNCKCNELQTDLINQKICEIHMVSRIVASRGKEPSTPSIVKPFFPPSGSDSGEDLNNIARNLSKLIQDAKSCKNCRNTHTDMIDTVQYIKNLVDMVNADKEVLPTTDTMSDMFCKCVDWKKLREEMQIEEPTYELLKKIHSLESVPTTTPIRTPRPHTPPKKQDRSSVVETVEYQKIRVVESVPGGTGKTPLLPKKEDKRRNILETVKDRKIYPIESIPSVITEKTPPPTKQSRRESSVERAEDIMGVLLTHISSEKEARVEDEYKTQNLGVQRNEEMEHEKIEGDEIGAETEVTTQIDRGQLFSKPSDPPADMVEDDRHDITTDVDEKESVMEDIKETPKQTVPENEDLNVIKEDVIETIETAEGNAEEKGQATEVPVGTIEESVTETIETAKGNEEEDEQAKEVPTEAIEEIRFLFADEVEEHEEVKGDEDLHVTREVGEYEEEPKSNEEGAPEETADEEETTYGEPVTTAKPMEEENVAEELIKVDLEATTSKDDRGEEFNDVRESIEIKPVEEDKTTLKLKEEMEVEEGLRDDVFEQAEVISDEAVQEGILEEYTAPSAEGEIISEEEKKEIKELVASIEQLETEQLIPEDEIKEIDKDKLSSVPVEQSVEKLQTKRDQDDLIKPATLSSGKALVADIVRTICKCIKREQPTLCDCLEKERGPTRISSISSKNLHIERIVSDVLKELYAKTGELKATSEEESGFTKKPLSTRSSAEKSLSKADSEIAYQKSSLEAEGGDVILQSSAKLTKSLSKEVSKKSVRSKLSDQLSLSHISSKVSSIPISKKSSSKLSSKEPSKETLSEEKGDMIERSSSQISKRMSKESSEVLSKKKSKIRSRESSKKSFVDRVSKRSSEIGELVTKQSSEKTISPKISKSVSGEPTIGITSKELSEKALFEPGPDIPGYVSPEISQLASKEVSNRSLDKDASFIVEKETLTKTSSLKSTEKISKTHSDVPVASPRQITSSSKEISKRFLPAVITSRQTSISSAQRASKQTSKKSLFEKESSVKEEIVKIPSEQDFSIIEESTKIISEEESSIKGESIKILSEEESSIKEESIKILSEEESSIKEESIKILSEEESSIKEESIKILSEKESSIKEDSIKIPSEKESSIKEDQQISEKYSHFSEEDTLTISSSGAIQDTVIAELVTESNVPSETEVEFISKSSDGIYVTTTVTSLGHVEVTTEGPTGVVETTLKVTESGNLEVVTGVTEYDHPILSIDKEAESAHSQITVEIEVIHPPVCDIEESQETLDIRDSAKSLDHGSSISTEAKEGSEQTLKTESVAKVSEETKSPSEGTLGVIREEEEEADKGDKTPIEEGIAAEEEVSEGENKYEEEEIEANKMDRRLSEELPLEKKACKCSPVIIECKCRRSVSKKEDDLKREDIESSLKEVHEEVDISKAEQQLDEIHKEDEEIQEDDQIQEGEDGTQEEGDEIQEEEDEVEEETSEAEEETSEAEQETEEADEGADEAEEGEDGNEEDVSDFPEEADKAEEDPKQGEVEKRKAPKTPAGEKKSIQSVEIVEEPQASHLSTEKRQHEGSSSTGSSVSSISMFEDLHPEKLKNIKESSIESAPTKSFLIETSVEYSAFEQLPPSHKPQEKKTSRSILKSSASNGSNDAVKDTRSLIESDYAADGISDTSKRSVQLKIERPEKFPYLDNILQVQPERPPKLEELPDEEPFQKPIKTEQPITHEELIEEEPIKEEPIEEEPVEEPAKEEPIEEPIKEEPVEEEPIEEPAKEEPIKEKLKIHEPVIQPKTIAVETSTADLGFSTCECEWKQRRPTTQDRTSETSDKYESYPGTTAVNNLKIIICNRDSCKNYPEEEVARIIRKAPSLPKCECPKSIQEQLAKIYKIKDRATCTSDQQEKKSKVKSSVDKLLLENATCTTCDKTSCQVIKSGSQYTSIDSLLPDDDVYHCPGTCPKVSKVGIQAAPKKDKTEFVCPKSCDDIRTHEKVTVFREKTTKSYSRDVCADLSQNQDVCVPSCPTRNRQAIPIKYKSRSTNTPWSGKIYNLDISKSSQSGQRTVSTYYSCNLAETRTKLESPSESQKLVCDPNVCKKKNVSKTRTSSEPKVLNNLPKICDPSSCKKDASTGYRSPSIHSQKSICECKNDSGIKKKSKPPSPSHTDSPRKPCTCEKKTPVSKEEGEKISRSPCTSVTCSAGIPGSPKNDLTGTCTSATCSASKFVTPASSVGESLISNKLPRQGSGIICTSATCPSRKSLGHGKELAPTTLPTHCEQKRESKDKLKGSTASSKSIQSSTAQPEGGSKDKLKGSKASSKSIQSSTAQPEGGSKASSKSIQYNISEPDGRSQDKLKGSKASSKSIQYSISEPEGRSQDKLKGSKASSKSIQYSISEPEGRSQDKLKGSKASSKSIQYSISEPEGRSQDKLKGSKASSKSIQYTVPGASVTCSAAEDIPCPKSTTSSITDALGTEYTSANQSLGKLSDSNNKEKIQDTSDVQSSTTTESQQSSLKKISVESDKQDLEKQSSVDLTEKSATGGESQNQDREQSNTSTTKSSITEETQDLLEKSQSIKEQTQDLEVPDINLSSTKSNTKEEPQSLEETTFLEKPISNQEVEDLKTANILEKPSSREEVEDLEALNFSEEINSKQKVKDVKEPEQNLAGEQSITSTTKSNIKQELEGAEEINRNLSKKISINREQPHLENQDEEVTNLENISSNKLSNILSVKEVKLSVGAASTKKPSVSGSQEIVQREKSGVTQEPPIANDLTTSKIDEEYSRANEEIIKKESMENRLTPTESSKIPKLSPKSASRYTLTERDTSIIDSTISKSKDVLHAGSLKSKSSISRKSLPHSKKSIIEAVNEETESPQKLKDSEHKISRQSSEPTGESGQTDQNEPQEVDLASQKRDKSSKASSIKSPVGSKGRVEISKMKSGDKLPQSPIEQIEGVKQPSKESICLPCGRYPARASGDEISKLQKKPPDKESDTSIGTTESEKKSKSKIPVMKTSSLLKEKHQGDCSCVECLTEEIQKSGHPPDCDCVDCLCRPKRFEQKLPTVQEPEQAKEPDQPQHSPSCTCIDCLCAPQDVIREQLPERKLFAQLERMPHSPSCDCIDCLCAPTSEKKKIVLKETIRKVSETIFVCPSIPPVKTKHHPKCKCPECVCNPCGHQPDCSCALCKCDPCKDVIVQFKKHPPDCSCPDCICAPCGDEKVEEQRKIEQHPPDCNCPDCLCEPCGDTKVQILKEKQKHPPNCNCPDCLCEPCKDSEVQDKKKQVEIEEPKKQIEEGDCTCEECICDPCDDPKIVAKKQTCQKCECVICVCDPCADPKIVADRKPHPPSCNCPKCLCDPCNDPTKTKAHGPGCTCEKCICHPCKPDIKHGPNCDCPTCSCNPCTDLQPKPSIHGPDCTCEKCKKVVVAELQHSTNCRCSICKQKPVVQKPKPTVATDKHSSKCKCSVCKHKLRQQQQQDTSEVKPNAQAGELSGIPEECPDCDCSPICICDDCPAMRNNTAPVAKNMKNETLRKSIKNIEQENIRREKDIRELEGLMNQIHCACRDAEQQATRTNPQDPMYMQKASSFKNTLSGLQIAMNTLQEKCRVKDKMIEAMTQELRLRANSNIFEDMLRSMADLPAATADFDRHEVCDSLPRPLSDHKYGRTSARYTDNTCICNQQSVSIKIISVKPISPNSILIKWTQAELSQVVGYEVVIDNILKSRIHSLQRTSAVVFAIDIKKKINISIFAITQFGRCQPPATYVYG